MLKKLALVAALAVPGAMAHADSVQIGTLLCDVGPSIGFLVTSTPRRVDCEFRREGALSEYYTGSMKNLGLNLGGTSAARIVWLVFAGVDGSGRNGLLGGTYVGAEGNASVVVGGGVNALAGGFRNSISLQPFSVQGQVGLNVNVSAVKMKLRKVQH